MNDEIIVLESTTFSGKRFTRKQLAQIQDTVNTFPNLSRRELGHTICENLRWTTPKGSHKIQSCLSVLEQMEEIGLIKLPDKNKYTKNVTQKKLIQTDRTKERTLICCNLDKLLPISIQKVTQKEDIKLWNEYVDRYHYLNYKRPIGNHLRYFIVSRNQNQEILGCLLFSATAVWSLSCRDSWIGWEKKDRVKRLNLILNNSRFLIFPWVSVKFLASKVLSIISKQIADDWEEIHSYKPVLLETFVNPSKFKGTCYQAANWQYLGLTSGHNWIENNGKTSPKETYVYSLNDNFRAILKNEKSIKSTKPLHIKQSKEVLNIVSNDPFIQLWQNIADLVFKVANEFDQKWQKRKRVINTMLIILFIFRLVFSKNIQGYGITIIELWDHCRKMNFPLPQYKPVAPSALCNARAKLDENIFKIINTKVIDAYENNNAEHRWKQHRIFAVDGTKINLPRQLISSGYQTPSDNAHYPQGLVSCIYQLKSKIPYDFDLVSHSDERKVAVTHFKVLKQNDVVVYDRGYFSYIMLYCHVVQGIHTVFRIQKNTYKVIQEFMTSDSTDTIVTIKPVKSSQKEILSKKPDIKFIPIKLRLLKYTISGTTYTLGTTLLDSNYKLQEFADCYHSRWGIEELYKISKVLIDVEEFHGRKERGVKQELFAHFTLITLNRIFANHVEDGLNNPNIEDVFTNKDNCSNQTKTRKKRINFKNALITIARNLEGLFIQQIIFVKKTVQNIITSIFSCKQKERPNRSYERRSRKPLKKFMPSKIKKAASMT